ncbi:MAG: hypothetical protein IKH03_01465 [Oscillospiraceae bacterium]|nr:hypothetical protein [Oscillospiraceae bacterium]
MLIVGLILASAGVGGVAATLINTVRLNRFPSSMVTFFVVSFLLLIIGVLLIAFSVIKKRNKDRLDSLRGLTGDGEKQTVCSNCGLNVMRGAATCPRCGNTIS